MPKRILFVLLCLVFAVSVQAAPVEKQIEDLNQQIADLTKIISRLEARVAALETALEGKNDTAGSSSQAGAGPNAMKWKLVKKGLGPDQVRTLLGEPEKVVNNIRHVLWQYGDGHVKFDRTGKAVTSWKEQ